MASLEGFNAADHESQDFEALPAGQYLAVISASEFKQTKAGTGSYLKLTFQVIEGAKKGRNLWSQLNLDNPNETAVKIAKGDLAAICRAVGIMTPKDSSELPNLPLSIRVTQKTGTEGEIRNEVKGFRPANPDQEEESVREAEPDMPEAEPVR